MDLDDDTLALDVIRSVGLRGSYLDHEHTLRHLRSGENVYFERFDRSACRAPRRDIHARAKVRCDELLQRYQGGVPAEVAERLNRYVQRFE